MFTQFSLFFVKMKYKHITSLALICFQSVNSLCSDSDSKKVEKHITKYSKNLKISFFSAQYSLKNIKAFGKYQIDFDTAKLEQLENASSLEGCEDYLELLKEHIDQSDVLFNSITPTDYSIEIQKKVQLFKMKHAKNVIKLEKFSKIVFPATTMVVTVSTEDYATKSSDNVAKSMTGEGTTADPTEISDNLGTTASVSSTTPFSMQTEYVTDPATTISESRGLYCILSLKLAKTRRLFGYSSSNPDPFVIVKIDGNHVFGDESMAKKDTIMPEWQFELEYSEDFLGEDGDHDVEIEIFESDLLTKNDDLGSVNFVFKNSHASRIKDTNGKDFLKKSKFRLECEPTENKK